jgi:hypothetical protein
MFQTMSFMRSQSCCWLRRDRDGDRNSNRTAAGVGGTEGNRGSGSGEPTIEGLGSARAQCEPTGSDGGRGGEQTAVWEGAGQGLAGVRSPPVQGVARLLRDQATGGGYHCTSWSKTYSGCGCASASQSRTTSTIGASQAGGARAGLIRGGSTGSPMWLRIR